MNRSLSSLAIILLVSFFLTGKALASSSIEIFIPQITDHRINAQRGVFMGETDEISLPLKELHKIGCRVERRNQLVCTKNIRGSALMISGKGSLKKSKQKNTYKVDKIFQPSALIGQDSLVTCQGTMGDFTVGVHSMNKNASLLILYSDSIPAEELAAVALFDSWNSSYVVLGNHLKMTSGRAHSFLLPPDQILSFDTLSITPAFSGTWAEQIPNRFTDCELP